MTDAESASAIAARLGTKLLRQIEFRGESTIVIAAENLREVAILCRDEHACDYLLDISSVDNVGEDPRFEVVYELYSMNRGTHLRIKLSVDEEIGAIATVSDLWPTANWHEREIFDMMGIRFHGHPDLRRILMWDGYPFFPLLKDFPLEGKPSSLPDVAFTQAAPMEGGPFVTLPSTATTKDREPRARRPDL